MKKSIVRPFRVLCIDPDNKPEPIDDSEWINYNEEYIVTNVFTDLITGVKSFKLLGKNPYPFEGYLSTRFSISFDFSVN